MTGSRQPISRTTVSVALLGACVLAGPSLNAATRTVTGVVGDAMCGATHPTTDAAACTRTCVKKGSAYTLVVNGTVYTLKADASSRAELRKLAGKIAVVRGDVEDNTVTVTSVVKAKKIKKH